MGGKKRRGERAGTGGARTGGASLSGAIYFQPRSRDSATPRHPRRHRDSGPWPARLRLAALRDARTFQPDKDAGQPDVRSLFFRIACSKREHSLSDHPSTLAATLTHSLAQERWALRLEELRDKSATQVKALAAILEDISHL
jgi:hypothetical protein